MDKEEIQTKFDLIQQEFNNGSKTIMIGWESCLQEGN